MGRVRSFKRIPCHVLSPATEKSGYLGVGLRKDGKCVHKRIHQLVMLAFIGPCPDGLEVCHGPGGPGDNRLSNLRYDTHLANVQESPRPGNLSPEQISHARKLFQLGAPRRQLAMRYKVSWWVIRKATKDISSPPDPADETARRIREEYAQGSTSYSKLAKREHMDQSFISLIVTGKRYRNAGGPIKGIDY